MSKLTVYARYDSQQKAWDAILDGKKISVTTAFLYSLI